MKLPLLALLPLGLATAHANPAPRIAWWPTIAQGQAEAARSGKPILLLSAAPQCHNVPGIW
ncbi:MAG: hypothetical protein O3A92_16610 [Verrucomicrobia bacterium]|nr:hypothetical protein [Verrucomicrobiota bacterium]